MKIVAARIYADSISGYRDGVPRWLDLMNSLGARGSFFFGMGSESTGSAISKLFKTEQNIVAAAPGILRDAYRRGQDCGIYGWNPKEWETRFEKLKDTTIESNIRRAIELFARRAGVRPSGFASPGWRTSYISLRIQDEMRFRYCSDTFGLYPYLPRISWKKFSTVQIPSTLPPLENVLKGLSQGNTSRALTELKGQLREGLNVLPASALLGANAECFAAISEFFRECSEEGVRFLGLDTVAASLDRESLPECDVADMMAEGMDKPVSAQSFI